MKLIDKLLYKFLGANITYSQSGEDVIIDHYLRNKGLNRVNYLDIGTNDPVRASNTYLFYRNGGSGVCVEPNPTLCDAIKAKRPKDVCLNVGVSSHAEESLDFYIMNPDTLSTFSKGDAEELATKPGYSIREIKKVRLESYNAIIKEYFAHPPDLVSIDVEGLNQEIVESIDFSSCRPHVFCVESVEFTTGQLVVKNEEIIRKFVEHNYLVYADTYLNTIFIDKEKW